MQKMVTVVATQELNAEHVLLRFKAGASQDEKHGSRSIIARAVFGNCCYTWDSFHFCLSCFCSFFVLFFPQLFHVCMCV